MTYSEKLRDPRWQKKRLEILNRDEFTCTICGDDKSTLHVHHLQYKGNPWEIDSDNLKTLCENCHFIVSKVSIEHENAVLKCLTNQIINGKVTEFILNPKILQHG